MSAGKGRLRKTERVALLGVILGAPGLPGCAKPAQPEVSYRTNDPTSIVGGEPISEGDLERLRQHYAMPLYAWGDLDGDQTIGPEDVTAAAALQNGDADADSVGCGRAMDVDFDAVLSTTDAEFIASIEGYHELHLFLSYHLWCRAFAPVAIQASGVTEGRSYPLLLLHDLAVGGDHNTYIEIVGPASLSARGDLGKDFDIHVDDGAASDDEIEIFIHTGYEDYDPDGDPDGLPPSTDGRTYVIPLTVG